MQPPQPLKTQVKNYIAELQDFIDRANYASQGISGYIGSHTQENQVIGSNAYGQFKSDYFAKYTSLYDQVKRHFDSCGDARYERLDASGFQSPSETVTALGTVIGIAERQAKWFATTSFWL